MGVDKRCKLSQQQSKMQRVKIYLRKTLQNQSKCMHKRRFAAMSLLQGCPLVQDAGMSKVPLHCLSVACIVPDGQVITVSNFSLTVTGRSYVQY